jgi:hypothetical protein
MRDSVISGVGIWTDKEVPTERFQTLIKKKPVFFLLCDASMNSVERNPPAELWFW